MVDTGLILAYSALLTMAVVPIYVGSLYSLTGIKRPKNAPKRKKKLSPLVDSGSESEHESESISSSDAYMFPLYGSAVLFSLYMLFRYLNKEYINYLLTAYFAGIGIFGTSKVGLIIARNLVPLSLLKNVDKYKINILKNGKQTYSGSATYVHLGILGLSVLLTAYYVYTKNWIASNIFGVCLSLNAINLLSLDSFMTGIILLSGLFFYDIFWVFGTEVMVSVAKNFDAPVKVVWPKDVLAVITGQLTGKEIQYTMLGLGDIVIPGIFVALCLRFDHRMAWQRDGIASGRDFRSSSFPKPYFLTNFAAYILGLITTIVVMHTFKAAQPALLYLSPACIFSALGTAIIRGELKDLWAYDGGDEDTQKQKESKKSKKKAKEQQSKEEAEPKEDSKVSSEMEPKHDKEDTPLVASSQPSTVRSDIEEEDFVEVGAEDVGNGAGSPVARKNKKKKGRGTKSSS